MPLKDIVFFSSEDLDTYITHVLKVLTSPARVVFTTIYPMMGATKKRTATITAMVW